MANNQIKVDLHTHSTASLDGGITADEYFSALDSGLLNAIAITDHNTLGFALEMAKRRPTQIIAGEEIMTRDGEIIGLFLNEEIPPRLSARETIQLIKAQNGLVYIPHPLEKLRNGLSLASLAEIAESISAVELINGRALRMKKPALEQWAEQVGLPALAASDAHSAADLGRTYSLFATIPTVDNFHSLAEEAETHYKPATIRGRLAPKLNRFKNRKTD